MTGKKKTKLKVTPCCVEYDTYTEIIAIDKGNYHINTLKAEIKFILGKKTDFFVLQQITEKAEAECKTAIKPSMLQIEVYGDVVFNHGSTETECGHFSGKRKQRYFQ